MEILMPVGNQEHVDLAIQKHVDAVYGGLKKWNARQRASNFTIQEYNLNVEKLHKNNSKFYLTINTPLLDYQIKQIIDMFHTKTLKIPDAIIAADVGFITEFHKSFPEIPIHASTQMGTHCEADLMFLKDIGVSRAVLARELTEEEIKDLICKEILEIECFGWGAQCISFSGLCFYGSFIGCGNGNLGKCISPCRDRYLADKIEGQLLFLPDLNCVNVLQKVEGLSSLKIEGRRRRSQELKTILDYIYDKNTESPENGYVQGTKIKENNLFNLVSQRKKPLYHISCFNNISKLDVFARFSDGKPIEFMHERTDDSFYIYSQVLQAYDFKKANIIIELAIKKDMIQEIRIILDNGEYVIVSDHEIRDKIITMDEVIHSFMDIKQINIIKIQYQRNITNKYYISSSMYRKAIEYLLNLPEKKRQEKIQQQSIDKDIYVEVDSINVAEELIKRNEKVIFNISSIQEFLDIEHSIDILKNNVIYKLPLFNWKSIHLGKVYQALSGKQIMFTRWSQIYEAKEIFFEKKYIDYTIYAWNQFTVSLLESMGIEGYTATPELDYKDNFSIFNNRETQYIIAGEMPVMYTRMCFSHLYNCESSKGCYQKHRLYNMDKQLEMTVLCRNDHRLIINNVPILNNVNKIKSTNFTLRYVAYDKNIQQIVENLKLLKSYDYYEKMKLCSYWKDSFELYNDNM